MTDHGSGRAEQAVSHCASDLRAAIGISTGSAAAFTIVKEYVRSRRQSTSEALVPLHHPPGDALRVDFVVAVVELGGRREKVAFFCPDLAAFQRRVRPEEDPRGDWRSAFMDGQGSVFDIPTTRSAADRASMTTRRLTVARLCLGCAAGVGARPAFTQLQAHVPVRGTFSEFARQGQRQGQGRGPGEDCMATVDGARIPMVHGLSVLIERHARADALSGSTRWRQREKAAALKAEGDAKRDLPAVRFEACEHVPGQISSRALSALPAEGLLGAGCERQQDGHGEGLCRPGRDRARRRYRRPPSALRCRHQRRQRPSCTILSLLEKKPGALDQAAPLRGCKQFFDPAFDTHAPPPRVLSSIRACCVRALNGHPGAAPVWRLRGTAGGKSRYATR